MKETVVGNNGTGKTLYLRGLIHSYQVIGATVVTNMEDYREVNIDSNKVQALLDNYNSYSFTDSEDVEVTEHGILLCRTDLRQSVYFQNLVNLLCSKGTVLILDEPEFRMSDEELPIIAYMIQVLSDVYENVHMSTHYEGFHYVLNGAYAKITDKGREEITEGEAGDILVGI